jgi:glycosyltransferase involved in cell wall biosynthesis
MQRSDYHICVVIAVYNRSDNVRMALHSWRWQTCQDFSIVVADDGSDEDILALAKQYDCQYYRQRYGNVAVMLNKGTTLAPDKTTHVWYTDGDILFNPEAMQKAYTHVKEYPERVITGRYDWLPAMRILPIHDWDRILHCQLPRLDMETGMGGWEQSGLLRNVDHRLRDDPQFFEHKLLDSCRPLLGANVIIPLDAWFEIGGWDERIPGSNANDCDFGWDLTDAGYEMLTCGCVLGLHQYHPRDGEKLRAGVREALQYIYPKHGQEIPERWK